MPGLQEREFRLSFGGRDFVIATQPGVFSYGEPDEGSLLLLDTRTSQSSSRTLASWIWGREPACLVCWLLRC